jgi:hypothetical protein
MEAIKYSWILGSVLEESFEFFRLVEIQWPEQLGMDWITISSIRR